MFLDSLDIANRACEHCGVDLIQSVTEDSVRNTTMANLYDKTRRAELQRNSWRFAIKKTVLRAMTSTTLILSPGAYNSGTTYLPGEIVADANSCWWVSQTADNVNNTPGANNDDWAPYFGPKAADVWDSTLAYEAGELCYVVTGVRPNGYQLYVSLISGNTDTPGTATAWDATVQYNQDQVVSYSSALWRSLLPVNLNNTPATGPTAWASGTAYSEGNQVTGSDNFIYTAVGSTTGNDPTTDDGTYWTNTDTMTAWMQQPALTASSSVNWRPLTAELRNPFLIYPLGAGPAIQNTTMNVFRLPAGYLKKAPQDPKAGQYSLFGAPTNRLGEQWNFEGDYIVAPMDTTIRLRFIADITRVRDMADMFCEGLAARMALGATPTLNNSDARLATIAKVYSQFMTEARSQNFLEIGAIEPALDDWLATRG